MTLLTVPVYTAVDTHYAFPRRDGQAELACARRGLPIPVLTEPDVEQLYVDCDQFEFELLTIIAANHVNLSTTKPHQDLKTHLFA